MYITVKNSFYRVPLAAALAGLLSLASCDLAGGEGGPGPAPTLLGSLSSTPQAATETDNFRASVSGSSESNGYSYNPTVSGDGRFVAFASYASNIVPNDNNGESDIFVRDTAPVSTTGSPTTRLVSFSTVGAPDADGNKPTANSYSSEPFISTTGRYIVFASQASDIDPADTNNVYDIYLYDGDPGNDGFEDDDADGADEPTVVLVSLANDESLSNNYSFRPSVSGDGNRICWYSQANNLVTGDGNNNNDVFVRDRNAGTTVRVSVEGPGNPDGILDGTNANGGSWYSCISGNGNFVLYLSYATDIITGDANGQTYDVFRVNVNTLATDLVSRATGVAGAQANNYSYCQYFSGGGTSLSFDGSIATFASYATNLAANDTNNTYDVFIRNFNDASTTRILGPNGQPNSFTFDARVSGNGAWVSFHSDANNMGYDANYTRDAFVYHRASGSTILASVNTNGDPSNDYCDQPVISGDGLKIVFMSYAYNLVDSDANGQSDIFSHSLATGETIRISTAIAGGGASGNSYNSVMSADGRSAFFQSDAPDLVPGDSNFSTDIFMTDLVAKKTKRVSLNSNGDQGNNGGSNPSCSADGRFVAFDSYSDNLSPTGDGNGRSDIFVRDIVAGLTFRVSVNSAGGETNNDSFNPSISADGRYVAFMSFADNLVDSDNDGNFDNDQNGTVDVFLHDRITGTTIRVSEADGGGDGNNPSYQPRLSGNGRFVAFTSDATNLIPGGADTNNAQDVYLWDRDSDADGVFDEVGFTSMSRISVGTGNVEGNNDSYEGSLSDDGRFVTFTSFSDNYLGVGNDTNDSADVFLHDRATGQTIRISVNSAGGEGAFNQSSFNSRISGNGLFVIFSSDADNFVDSDNDGVFDNDGNGTTDVFVRNLVAGRTTRISVDKAGVEANGPSEWGSISADGRWASFHTGSSNLVPGDTPNFTDVMVRGPLAP